MNKFYRWILVAITLGVLTACAEMGSSVYESTPVPAVSMPASAD